MLVQSGDGSELFFAQGEFEEIEIFAEMLGRLRLGDGNSASVHRPAKGDLRGGALMGFRDFEKDRIGQDAFIFPGHFEREIGIGPERREGRDGDAFFLAIAHHGVLGEVGMKFDLVHRGLDTGVRENVAQRAGSEITSADS